MITRPSNIALMLSGLGLFVAMPASATVIVDGLSAYAEAQAGSAMQSFDGPNTSMPSTSAGANSLDGGSSSYGSAFGRTNGVYGVGANGNGDFDSTGKFIRTWEITNTTGVAQNYSFDFYIYGGYMYADDYGLGGNGFAEYLLDISFGGTSIYASSARINSDGSFTEAGEKLEDADASGSSYFWNGTYVTLDLGLLNPGDTSLLQYDLIGHAFGNYDFADCGNNDYGYADGYGNGYGDGYGDVAATFVSISEQCTGTSYVFMGDPSGITGTPVLIPSITNQPHGVPEPGMLGLLGISLAAWAAVYRRQRRN